MDPWLLSMLVSFVGMFIFGFGRITGCSSLVWGTFCFTWALFNVSAYHTIIKYNELCQCFIINNSRMRSRFEMLVHYLYRAGMSYQILIRTADVQTIAIPC